jgi:hypothetical protein
MIYSKPILVVFTLMTTASLMFSQRYDPERICKSDTLTGYRRSNPHEREYAKAPRGVSDTFRYVWCSEVSPLAFRVDMGFSWFRNEPAMRDWVGHHNGHDLGVSVSYKRWSIGARFKLETVLTKRPIDNSTMVLPEGVMLNPVKIDYYFGYAFDIGRRFTVEPSLGVTKNMFKVIEPELKELNWDFANVYGLLAGVTLNQYIRLNKTKYLVVWGQVNSGASNYQKIHPTLGRGYVEFSIGVGYKIFGKRHPIVVIR